MEYIIKNLKIINIQRTNKWSFKRKRKKEEKKKRNNSQNRK